MKTYALFTIIYFILFTSSAKIINGYEEGIQTARISRKHLAGLSRDRNVLSRMEQVKEFILHYELTEKMLDQFRTISPVLYNQIDNIKDFKGRLVNVYVRFASRPEVPEGALATTNLNQLNDDPHGYSSNYGPHTVSVKILIVKHSLLILAHEFGHISYQVPNLDTYVKFFLRNYQDHNMKANYMGHKTNDPSGQRALAFEKQFREENLIFSEVSQQKLLNPILIRDQLAKSID